MWANLWLFLNNAWCIAVSIMLLTQTLRRMYVNCAIVLTDFDVHTPLCFMHEDNGKSAASCRCTYVICYIAYPHWIFRVSKAVLSLCTCSSALIGLDPIAARALCLRRGRLSSLLALNTVRSGGTHCGGGDKKASTTCSVCFSNE